MVQNQQSCSQSIIISLKKYLVVIGLITLHFFTVDAFMPMKSIHITIRTSSTSAKTCNLHHNDIMNTFRKTTPRQNKCPTDYIHRILSKPQSKVLMANNNENGNESNYKNENTDNNNDNIDKSTKQQNEKKDEILDPIYILPITTTTIIIIGICLILYNINTNPTTTFDIDFYMALDGTMNTNGGAGGAGNNGQEAIIGLPQLSPAEKIVGALFGPPSSNQY